MAFWGQQLWLVGAFAMLALLGTWLYALADINLLNPQPMSKTDWFFNFFILFWITPILFTMACARIRLTLGYPGL